MAVSHSAFDIISSKKIHELATTATLYRHKKTGAEILSLENNDENLSFSITFRTPPEDSTGVAHILEHSVLCGSKKYPLKEPFVELIKASMHTFLNAFTYPDKTSYPVASTNEQDFYNLIDVYLDAVLHPLLSTETLMQEGWHLEPQGEKQTLKGVVYNEMKGAYSSADRAAWEEIQHALLPSTPYAHDSGGHPAHIPDLTYEQFLSFHTTHYHPSNALVFFSGKDDPARRLDIIDQAFAEYTKRPQTPTITKQPPFSSPVSLLGEYPLGQQERPSSMVVAGWAFPEFQTPYDALLCSLIGHLLLDNSSSVLRKALIDSGLGTDLTPSGMELELRQPIFSVGLKGVSKDNEEKVFLCIAATLQRLADNGFPKAAIDASMNTIEFSLREQNSGSFPRGLSLCYGALAAWLHGKDPIASLAFEEPLKQLRSTLGSDAQVLQKWIADHLITNTHHVRMILRGSTTYNSRLDQEEQERIRHLDPKPDDLQRLRTSQERHDDPSDLAKLPRLSVDDLDPQQSTVERSILHHEGATILVHELPTNDVIYLDLAFDLAGIPVSKLWLIPLLCESLFELGTTHEDAVSFSERIHTHTGGLSAQMFIGTHKTTSATILRCIVRGKCLPQQADKMRELITKALFELNTDNAERFFQILLEEKTAFESDVVENGHQYARSRITSQLHPSDLVAERTSGIEAYQALSLLLKRSQTDRTAVMKELKELLQNVCTRTHLVVSVTTSPSQRARGTQLAKDLIDAIPAHEQQPSLPLTLQERGNEALLVPTLVNYVAKGALVTRPEGLSIGSSLVISRFLRTSWLWEQVRMQGGAYGAFSSYDSTTGVFTFASYRDPHIEETLKRFDQTGAFLEQLDVNPDILDRSILGAISDLDMYRLPDAKGFSSMIRYLTGIDDPFRQQIRDEVFATTAQDFRRFATLLSTVAQEGLIAVTTNAENPEIDQLPNCTRLSVL